MKVGEGLSYLVSRMNYASTRLSVRRMKTKAEGFMICCRISINGSSSTCVK